MDPDSCDEHALTLLFSGNRVAEDAAPMALGYAGHQFGHFVPQLGDGRAILIGEVIDRAGARRDIQLKGAGRTPYSRGGDGRAALGPVLREYVVSEAMHALGISTTRSLAAVLTGETVYRDPPQPGAILTRVAASHIRVGTFEYFAARNDHDAVRRLADYVIERHYPDVAAQPLPYLCLLDQVIERQAYLVARWMLVGFIHGVMNTDNMTVSGETIDYGPCAFMDAYDPNTVFSSIDARGRYAFANQPNAAVWNLARFAEALLPLVDADAAAALASAQESLAAFSPHFSNHWLAGMRQKLGLSTERAEDAELVTDLLALMQRNSADFTLTFRALCAAAEGPASEGAVRAMFPGDEYDSWARSWRERLQKDDPVVGGADGRCAAMRAVNPEFIPRNHRIEEMIEAAVERADFRPFETLLQVISQPFASAEKWADYARPPTPSERVLQTFCGT